MTQQEIKDTRKTIIIIENSIIIEKNKIRRAILKAQLNYYKNKLNELLFPKTEEI